jgi:hypothetical protein
LSCLRQDEEEEGKERKDKNGGDEPIWDVIHIYMEMS